MSGRLPNQLIQHYKNGAFGVYVGAGLSQGAGLPSWENLLKDLIAKCKDINAINGQKETELYELVKFSDKYLMLAQELRETLGSAFEKYIKEKFDDKTLKPTDTHIKLLELNSRFIITTNYDKLIEKAYVKKYFDVPPDLTYKEAPTINYKIINKEFFILKAHGSADGAPSEIVLTEQDYRKIIYNELGYQSVLHALFSTNNLLFVGASLKDPELALILRFIHNVFHGGSPDHYAIMNKEELTGVEIDRWRKDYNINIIPYDPKNNHEEIFEIISELSEIR
ncbi:SIR2 family protein [uncultured Pedobacter sp.]|uniref:SIR2 family protein n=1 Tax=uncultured Pedobacter sp. TaxID=246139 RepID=UPI0025E56B7A|nr:SIR2 family protein [uncultured Pedobacter sp.]